jgi:Cytosol aminopeptidase family, N-terminal domain
VQVTLVPNDLGRWDQARPGDFVLVPIWTDVRPLRGASGLLDWRMCGRLSSWMVAGKVTGAEGEQTLFPSGGRLAWRLVLAVGAGATADFTEKRLGALVRQMCKTARGLGVGHVAMALPVRDIAGSASPTAAGSELSARRALDVTLAEIQADPGAVADLTLLVPAASQKELAAALRLRAARA